MSKEARRFSWINYFEEVCSFRFIMPKAMLFPYPVMQKTLRAMDIKKAFKKMHTRRKYYVCPQELEDAILKIKPQYIEITDIEYPVVTKRGVFLLEEITGLATLYYKCKMAEYDFNSYIQNSREAFLDIKNKQMADIYLENKDSTSLSAGEYVYRFDNNDNDGGLLI